MRAAPTGVWPVAVALLLVAAAAIVALPSYGSSAALFLVGVALIEATFALSWNLLFARTGLLVFGHAGFFTIGAYLVGYLLKSHSGVPFLASIPAAMAAGSAAAAVLGILVIGRVSGIALAIITMALAEILRILISYSEALGRDEGLSGIPRPSLGFGAGPLNDAGYYWVICAVCLALSLLLYGATYGRFGRVLFGIRQDEKRAAFLGYDTRRYRIAAFTVSGGVASAAGGLYAPWSQVLTPEIGNIFHSAQPMLSALLGGSGYFLGPVIGTALFAEIHYLTRLLMGLSELIIGGTLIVIVLAAPSGVMGLLAALWRRAARHGEAASGSPAGPAARESTHG